MIPFLIVIGILIAIMITIAPIIIMLQLNRIIALLNKIGYYNEMEHNELMEALNQNKENTP